MKNKKINIGIDINEVLRALWLQFDKYYVLEFGESGVPEDNKYSCDFFNDYKWNDITEIEKELKEPEEFNNDISPIYYQTDEKSNEALADSFLFKAPKKIELTAKEVYNRFLFEDYVYEIFALAPMMYKGMDLDIKNFLIKYKDYADFTLYSVENFFSIPSTLFFLSKITSRFKTIKFIDEPMEMWIDSDILITADPRILNNGTPWGKKLIKVSRPYNEKIDEGNLKILHVNDLINNEKFEKLIKYKK